MNFSIKHWIAIALFLGLSLSLKVLVNPAWAGRSAAEPTTRTEVLRRFLSRETDGRLDEIAAPAGSADASGWRFRSGECQAAAFPSGPRGSLDLFARSHARRRDKVAYVYRGEFRATPPVEALAIDVIMHRLTSVVRPEAEPGYVVLVYPKACAAPTDLPWSRLPVS